MVIEPVQTHLIRIASDTRAAGKCETAVILDFVVHEKAVVIAVPAAGGIDRDCRIEVASVDEECLAVNLCCGRIAGLCHTCIVIGVALRKLVAGILLYIVFQIDSGCGLFFERAAILAEHANFPLIVACCIDKLIGRRHCMRIRHRGEFSLGAF